MAIFDQNLSPQPIPAGGYMRSWQKTGLRMLRAQERVMQGIAKAAKLEIKYGQDLVGSRMSLLDWNGTNTDARAGMAVREVESLMNMMRDVTEELNHSFADAAKLLTEGMEDTMRESEDALAEGFQQARDMARKSVDKGAEMSREGISRIQDVMPDDNAKI